MSSNRKQLLFVPAVILTAGLLIFLETKLPFFRNFLPVSDNNFVIAILNINILLILLLIFLATRILFKTYVEKKRGLWGSRLKTRLTLTVFSISIISSASLFILTTWFLFVSMDKWFSQEVEDTVENAQEMSQFYYEDLFGRYQKMGDILASAIREEKVLESDKKLERFIKKEGRSNFLGYLAVLDLAGEPIRTYSTLDDEVSRTLMEKSKKFIKERQSKKVVPLKDGELIMFLSTVTDDAGQPKALLFLGEKIRMRGTQRMEQISSAYTKFKKDARPLKKVVKYNFVIPLFLVAILSIFFSIWIGVKMATEIAIPLERVKEGAAIIARGRFDINLEDRGKDEIGTLVGAFNRMARELKIAKDEIEEKTKYMEVIVDNVATGIITTDVKGRILLLNRAGRDILKIETDDWMGASLKSVIGDDFRKNIRPFLRGIKEDVAANGSRETTLSLQNDTHLRACLTVLRDETGKPQGFIATFDDITHIMRAEKLATWREIAKRLTHEIKNPLTPIRLSAERLRRRVLPRAEGREKEILDETTSIILTSSDDITSMVNELNKLSETSSARTLEDVNSVVEETIAIYRNLYGNISFQFNGAAEMPLLRMDRDKMKRALINLITNAIKAIGSNAGTITVTTSQDGEKGITRIEVADTGPGIADEDKGRIFDPYFSKNSDGMGLGLAIVNSVILEHGGRIDARDNVPKGARMVIELPVVDV